MKNLFFTKNIYIGLFLNILGTVLLAFLIFGSKVFTKVFDIHIQDTYFVVSTWHVFLPLFVFICLTAYLIKKLF
jgi:hypothetical protein